MTSKRRNVLQVGSIQPSTPSSMPSTVPTSGWRSGGWRCATSSHIRSRASRLTTARLVTASSYATAPSVPDSSGSPGRLTSATGTSASELVVLRLVSVRVSVQGRRKRLCAPRRTFEGRAIVSIGVGRVWTTEANQRVIPPGMHAETANVTTSQIAAPHNSSHPVHMHSVSLHPSKHAPEWTSRNILSMGCLTELLTELKATLMRSLNSVTTAPVQATLVTQHVTFI